MNRRSLAAFRIFLRREDATATDVCQEVIAKAETAVTPNGERPTWANGTMMMQTIVERLKEGLPPSITPEPPVVHGPTSRLETRPRLDVRLWR